MIQEGMKGGGWYWEDEESGYESEEFDYENHDYENLGPPPTPKKKLIFIKGCIKMTCQYFFLSPWRWPWNYSVLALTR